MPSKHGAIGLLIGATSLVAAMLAFFPTGNSTKEARQRIENEIAIRAAEVKALSEIERSFLPNADFRTQEGVAAALETFGGYNQRMAQTCDLGAVQRLVRTYGKDQQLAELSSRINHAHLATRRVTDHLVKVTRSDGPTSEEELHHLVREYSRLLTEASAANSALHGFVVSITPGYFGY